MSVISLRLPNDVLFTRKFSFSNYKVNVMKGREKISLCKFYCMFSLSISFLVVSFSNKTTE